MITVESWDSLGHKSIVLFSWLSFCARTTLILYFHHWTVPQKWFFIPKILPSAADTSILSLERCAWKRGHCWFSPALLFLCVNVIFTSNAVALSECSYEYWYKSDTDSDNADDSDKIRHRECQRQKQTQSKQMHKLSLDNDINNSLDVIITVMN